MDIGMCRPSRDSDAVGPSPSTGTTIVACSYPGGVVLGADGRVSIGQYIMNRSSNKIAPLSESVFLLRSGSAPDTQIVSDYVRHFAHQMEAELGHPPSVEVIANLVRSVAYNNKDNLVAAMIVAGWDRHGGGQVYGCPIGGTLAREAWAVDGSGSSYIWGFCDAEYRDNFTREEAERFVSEAVALAMSRDGDSGGCIRLVTCDAEGVHHGYVQGDKVPLYFEELPRGTPYGAAGFAGGSTSTSGMVIG